MRRCADCGHEAVLLITEDGVQRALCATCVDLAAIPGLARLARSMRRPRGAGDHCPHCRTTADEFRRSGILGCPLCYEALVGAIRDETGLAKVEAGIDLW